MKNNKAVVSLAVLVGVLFIVAGVIYFTKQADALPSFFPGHDASSTVVHTKHAIGSLLLGVACFIFAWFQSGPKTTSPENKVN